MMVVAASHATLSPPCLPPAKMRGHDDADNDDDDADDNDDNYRDDEDDDACHQQR